MLIVLACIALLAVVATGLVLSRRRAVAVPVATSTGASAVPSAPSAPGDAPEITEPV